MAGPSNDENKEKSHQGYKIWLSNWYYIKKGISDAPTTIFEHFNGPNHFIYKLPKTYKTGNHPIVSNIVSPTYNVSKYLANVTKIIGQNSYFVRDTHMSLPRIFQRSTSENDFLASFNVSSLFTNIPIQVAIICFEKWWHRIENIKSLTFSDFFQLYLNSTMFVYNNTYFSGAFGTA